MPGTLQAAGRRIAGRQRVLADRAGRRGFSQSTTRNARAIDWSRLGRRSLLAGMVAVSAVQLALIANGTQYGFDFRGGTWQAGHAVLSARSPYPIPLAANLLHIANGFVTPPLLAVLAAPFSLLPFTPALVVWNLMCAVALAAGVYLLGVRDLRLCVLAFCTFPFVASVGFGQPDGLFALLAAVAWRYRDSPRGAIAGGALIAAKLLAWPLVLWLLVTRRARLAAITATSAIGWLAASWACIGFKGLAAYPRLLAAESRAYGPRSHSLVSAVMRLGVSLPASQVITLIVAAAVGAAIAFAGRRRDEAWFTAALVVGLLGSPVVWQHYLVLLFVPLAILRRLRDPLIWLLVLALWLSPVESPPTLWQTWLVPLVVGAVALRAVATGRSAPLHLRSASVGVRAQVSSK